LISLVRDVAATVEPLVQKNCQPIEIECAADAGTMYSDPKRVQQALYNLMGNAAKFTERGVITVRVSRQPVEGLDWVTISVTDTGIGMSREQVARLFQDFVQVDASTTRKHGGTGLGLAIARRFCRMMGGDITVRSEPERGSTFSLRLPAGAEAPQAAPVAAASASARLRTAAAEDTILVVDDDPAVRELVRRFLEREGFSVETSVRGRDALRLAREVQPAAITLDVMMPDLDGWTVLAAIKGDPELADIPVVLVSIVDERSRGYALGASDYMLKPINRERLLEVLRRICVAGARRVLVVDDDDSAARRRVPRSRGRRAGPSPKPVDGRGRAGGARGGHPDAIVLDLMMPGSERVRVPRRAAPQTRMARYRRSSWSRRRISPKRSRRRLDGGVAHVLQKSREQPGRAAVRAASHARRVPRAAPSRRGEARGVKILYVEDNDDNADILNRRLGRLGFQLVIATDGVQAIEMAGGRKSGPDPDGSQPAGDGRLGGDAPDQGGAPQRSTSRSLR
jgi:CheY-like chemotaxis protein/anti-sigma regulatory factor (Ser/Thr protein kinase)